MKLAFLLLAPLLVALAGCDASRVGRPAAPHVVVHDLFVGSGAAARQGDTLTVVYEGWLADGTKFDSSMRRPFFFRLGAGQVIRGWDLGLSDMRVGGKRRLVIPPELAYGSVGGPPVIPPNATLTYEVGLLDVRSP